MCGFVAIFHTYSTTVIDRNVLERMNEAQFHRGPDEGGMHIEPGVGLGHRRLSIIDLANGQQPLFNEDASVAVVFNGEIYNFVELTEELTKLGHRFKTHSDTEVIVHAWEQWGNACVDRFRGMFAFALWDRNAQTLFVARDRLGIKPVHYALLPNGELLVASELKAIRCHPLIDRTIDPLAVEDFCSFGYIPEPRTIFRAIKKLPPGFFLRWTRGRSQPERQQYWEVPVGSKGPVSEAAAAQELVARIDDAVRIRLVADVPLGAFLSGGVDSSTVLASMTRVGGKPVDSCSIAFGESEFNEAEYAKLVATRYAAKHHVETVDPDDFSLLDRLAGLYDEPYADSSAMPTYRVCELARRRVKVALSGDGGDELLAGYQRYAWQLEESGLRRRVPAPLRSLAGALGAVYPSLTFAPRFLRGRSTLRALARDTLAGYFNIIAVIDSDLKDRLYSPAFLRSLQGYTGERVLREYATRVPGADELSLLQYLDIKTYLPGDILTKVDRASMAHALEVRVPLLDHELVEWISGLPPELKRRGATAKYLLKKAMQPYLPEEVLYRPKKGFAVPLAKWFRGELRERVARALSSDVLHDAAIFDAKALQGLFREHLSGRVDRSASLWSVLMLEAFLRGESERIVV